MFDLRTSLSESLFPRYMFLPMLVSITSLLAFECQDALQQVVQHSMSLP